MSGTPTGRITSYKPMMAPLILLRPVSDGVYPDPQDRAQRGPVQIEIVGMDLSEIEARVMQMLSDKSSLKDELPIDVVE